MLNHEKNNNRIFIYSSFILSALVFFNISIMSEPKKIQIENVNSLYAYESLNKIVFQGLNWNHELYDVALPINEITDSLDYFIEKRINFIKKERKRLLDEQKELKSKLIAIKDCEIDFIRPVKNQKNGNL
tara:strand:- start:33 stop:422 length:390 start_codon:yes stop_codon:yes gene_type:complete